MSIFAGGLNGNSICLGLGIYLTLGNVDRNGTVGPCDMCDGPPHYVVGRALHTGNASQR